MKKYFLTVGLNDKDTKLQQLDTITCYKMISSTCAKFINGFTILEANGYYTHENGEVVVEKSLRVEIVGTDSTTIKKIIDEIKLKLNQESVMLEVQELNIKFV